MRLLLIALGLSMVSPLAFAQSKPAIPDVPEALEALSERGAQMRYLGREHGMDGWIAIYQGQEQYYYITQDGKAFVTGLMFGADGRPVTIEQVQKLQSQSGDVLDLLAEGAAPAPSTTTPPPTIAETLNTKSPAERMFADIQNSNTVRLGSANAPVIYSFIDPQCPHCHKFLADLRKDYIDAGLVQVRLIPVGFQQGSLAQAAVLLASPDAEERFYKHLDGDQNALPAKSDISTQAIQKNMALMQAWKFNVTPLTVYRSASGEIKIIRGVAKDIPGMIGDLPQSSQ